MKTFFYFSVLILIFFGCKKDNPIQNSNPDYLLTTEDKSWNIYTLNDTISFTSNHGHTRTYNIRSIQTSMVYSDTSNNKTEHLIISLERIDSVGYINFNIYRGEKYYIPQPSFHVNCEFSDFTLPIFSIVDYGCYSSYLINGTNYNNVYIVGGDDDEINGRTINKFYYKKENGILRFDNIFNEIWYRVN